MTHASLMGGYALLISGWLFASSEQEPGPISGAAQPEAVSTQLPSPTFDVFLSYADDDAVWVEQLARRLEDEEHLCVWLDKWYLIPGRPWQRELARGFDQARCCAVCIGKYTPSGWFREVIERALNRQASDPTFRVIPILLPDSRVTNVDNFLELRTWVDFRSSASTYAFHTLVCGIKGLPPGRGPREGKGK